MSITFNDEAEASRIFCWKSHFKVRAHEQTTEAPSALQGFLSSLHGLWYDHWGQSGTDQGEWNYDAHCSVLMSYQSVHNASWRNLWTALIDSIGWRRRKLTLWTPWPVDNRCISWTQLWQWWIKFPFKKRNIWHFKLTASQKGCG